MALDLQQNWNVSMAENLERTMKQCQIKSGKGTSVRQEDIFEDGTKEGTSDLQGRQENVSSGSAREPQHLPDEIVLQILAFIPSHSPTTQRMYASCVLVSKQWYFCATPFLYAYPRLYGNNFTPFVSTICPSINLHVRKSRLATMVKVLDLGALVHQGSRSVTARLLGRVKGNLQKFRAPQASFASNCFPALSKCTELEDLDLSLVSESATLPELFNTLVGLEKLRILRLPRSSGFGATTKNELEDRGTDLPWPRSLTTLSLSGGIDMHFVHGMTLFPPTLTDLTIEHCPIAKTSAIRQLIQLMLHPLPALKKLKVAHMPRLSSRALDPILDWLPHLEVLSVGAEYVTQEMLDVGSGSRTLPSLELSLPDDVNVVDRRNDEEHKASGQHLRVLELTGVIGSNLMDDAAQITPMDLIIALDDGLLPALRQVRAARSLGWSEAAGCLEETEHLSAMLTERGEGRDRNCGVWMIEG